MAHNFSSVDNRCINSNQEIKSDDIKEQLMNTPITTFVQQMGEGDVLSFLENGIYKFNKIYIDLQILYWTSVLVFRYDKMPSDIGLTAENDWITGIQKYITRANNISKAMKQSIQLRNKETGDTIHFESKAECRSYLGLSKDGWSSFLKGTGRANKIWEFVSA